MNFPKITIPWGSIIKVFLLSSSLILFIAIIIGSYFLGFINGVQKGMSETKDLLNSYVEVKITTTSTPIPIPSSKPTIIKDIEVIPEVNLPKAVWGGPELWEEVNIKRREYGVNPLSQKDELCTIASIRLNELLELGKLDGHEGFSNLSEDRPDLKWIFERYSVVAEFLAMGGATPTETVELWDNILGQKKLLDGGEYVWGCIYAQNTFAVAITAY